MVGVCGREGWIGGGGVGEGQFGGVCVGEGRIRGWFMGCLCGGGAVLRRHRVRGRSLRKGAWPGERTGLLGLMFPPPPAFVWGVLGGEGCQGGTGRVWGFLGGVGSVRVYWGNWDLVGGEGQRGVLGAWGQF